jgi:HEAT repeat protein
VTATASARIVALLALAEELPEVDDLRGFLTDAQPEVRRTALTVLSEGCEDWGEGSVHMARGLLDPDGSVRRTAAELLAELREVLVADAEFLGVLRGAAGHQDPAVRATAVGALWRHRCLDVEQIRVHLADLHACVRAEAVQGLVSLDALGPLDDAGADPDPAVRLAVARGLGTVGDPRGVSTLIRLGADPEPAVAAAALTALAETGCPERAAALAIEALADPRWQLREAAAKALPAADPQWAADPLVAATTDPNLDVRKAAVRALERLAPAHPGVPAALRTAAGDPDADVRAYARLALLRYPG